jgi:hypothetical protein
VDTVNIQATTAATATEVNGGAGNDVFNLGSATNSLGTIQGAVSFNGNANLATTTTGDAGTPCATTVVIGDTLNINDQGDTGDITYGIGAASVSRSGASSFCFQAVETMVLNTSTGNDTVTESAAPTGVDHLIINGNSQGGATPTVDTVNTQATTAGTATEVNGGAGNDVFNLGSAANSLGTIQGAVSFNGNGNLATTTMGCAGTQVATAVVIGDTLNINDQGDTGNITYGIGAASVSRTGASSFCFQAVETMALNTSTGNDTVTVSAAPTGVDHLIINGNSQGGATPTVDTFNVQTTGAGTATEVTGGAGNDVINIGSAANSMAAILGVVCVNGGANLTTTTTACAGTPLATSVVVGDTLILNDQGDAGNSSYGIGTALLTRSGVAGIGYLAVETVTLNTSTGNDTVEDGATTLPAATPAPVNLNGGAAAADHVIINGNSSAGTVDTVNVRRTGAATAASNFATEVMTGAGNDVINVGDESNTLNGILSPVCVNGGGGNNTLNTNDQGSTAPHKYVLMNTLVARDPNAAAKVQVTYSAINTLNANAGQGGNIEQIMSPTATTSNVNGGNGGDNFGVFSTVNTVNLNGGSGNDTFAFNNGSTLSGGAINGGGGTNLLDFGGNGNFPTTLPNGTPYAANVQVNLGPTATIPGGITVPGNVALSGATTIATLSNIQNVNGGNGNDTLIGSNTAPSQLNGGLGNDTLMAVSSGDTLFVGRDASQTNFNNPETLIGSALSPSMTTFVINSCDEFASNTITFNPRNSAISLFVLRRNGTVVNPQTDIDATIKSTLPGSVISTVQQGAPTASLTQDPLTPQIITPLATLFVTSTEARTPIIESFYQTYLGRAADQGGLNYWLSLMAAGVNQENIISYMVGSPEYYAAHGGTDAGFVTALYHDILGRSAAPAEVDYWVGVLASQPRNVVAHGFLFSDEFLTNGIESAYVQLLGRNADAGALTFWEQALRNGLSDDQLKIALLTSAEYISQFSESPGLEASYVDSLYQKVLGRIPSNSELQSVLTFLGVS